MCFFVRFFLFLFVFEKAISAASFHFGLLDALEGIRSPGYHVDQITPDLRIFSLNSCRPRINFSPL